MRIAIRQMTAADLPEVVAMMQTAGLVSGLLNVARYVRWQPRCGWLAVAADGAVVGSVTVLQHGQCGFVGCMAVPPAQQGGGIGRQLLAHAQTAAARAGVTTFQLEATAAGARLYRAMGYAVDRETVIVGSDPAPVAPVAARIATADAPAILALDRETTGLDRHAMIGHLLAERGPGAVIAVHGEVTAVGLVIGDRLAPLLVRDPGAGRAVIDELAPACVGAAVPATNADALDAFARAGFRELRRLQRMSRGPAIAERAHGLWALASPGAG